MVFSSSLEPKASVLSNNTKVIALDLSLQQSLQNFNDLVVDLEQLHVDSENYRLQYLSLKEKCETKTCTAAEEFKKVIDKKDKVIQSVASILTKLNETKNLNILADAFNILFENAAPLTPPVEDKSPKCDQCQTTNTSPTPKKNVETSIDDVSFKEESVCESSSSSTGRVSPIIHTKNTRSLVKTSDKKKCPNDWPTSDSKALKLTLTPSKSKSGKGRLRQARLNLVKVKQTAVVDLTCSPEVKTGIADKLVQPLIKKESMENDDTILPSPTSGPINFNLFKTTSKASPSKFKKPPLSLKNRTENVTTQDENKNTSKNETNVEMEESINILNQFANRIRNGIKKESNATVNKEMHTPVKKEIATPVKKEKETPVKREKHIPVKLDVPPDEDETNASISLLQHIEQLEEEHRKIQLSPAKRPLAENINIMNTPPKNDAESSMSILRQESKTATVENVKRKIPELVEPIYKEPAVRKKAEKRNLQGWSCEECMNFYGELYKNDPVMLARKINECSKHRGRRDPARPKTPPNFWNPRWHVPDDTEELNRMNNAT